MLRSSIDLGTNTCLLLIADLDEKTKKIRQIVGDHAKIVRLGEGVDQTRILQPEPMDRTLQCLKHYSALVRAAGGSPEDTVCVGTSQARDAQNSHEFFKTIQKETGFTFKTISGEEEAQFTFLGALLPEMDPQSAVVIDIGGGSTELMSIHGGRSIDVGSVRYTERFLKMASPTHAVTDEQFWKCQDEIDQQLDVFLNDLVRIQKSTSVVAVAGTATTLAAWHLDLIQFDAKKVDSLVLTRGDVHRMVEELKWRTVTERCELPGMDPMRADVILAGALILWRMMEKLGFPECRVSTRGLRYGILNSSGRTGL